MLFCGGRATLIKVGGFFCLFVCFALLCFGSECWEKKTLLQTTSLSDLPWIKLWRLKATPSHFLESARAQRLYAQILCASAESLHRWSATAWEVNSQSVLGLPLLAKERALSTRAHFLLSDLTLDSPKIELLVRCVLSSPSRQWKQHLSSSSES